MKKKLRTTLLTIFILITCFISTSCQETWKIGQSLKNDKVENNENNTFEDEVLTRKWVMDYYKLSEDEVQSFDIDLMIKHGYLYDKGKTISRYPDKETFLESISWLHDAAFEKEHAQELSEANNFTYLLEGDSTLSSSYDQIKYLGIESVRDDRQPNETDPTGKVSLLIDFKEKKIYYKTWDESVLVDIRTAEQVVNLSQEDIEYIKEKMKEADFLNWSNFKVGEDFYDNWTYGFETYDGLIYSNMVENLPKNKQAWLLFNELFSHSVPHPIMSK